MFKNKLLLLQNSFDNISTVVKRFYDSIVTAPERYWVGDGSSTDWNNKNNWSTTSGGVGGVSIPTSSNPVFFDINSLGNCTLTEDVSIGGFSIDSSPGTFNDGGYTVNLYGSLYSPYDSALKWVSTGTWIVRVDTINNRFGTVNPRIYKLIIDSGVTFTCSNYMHVKNLELKDNATVMNNSSGNYMIIVPVNDNFLIMDPTAYIEDCRIYIYNEDRRQNGLSNIGNIQLPYGSAGTNLIMDGDFTIGGSLIIHAGSTHKTETQARVLDMNGYNLTVPGTITLGNYTAAHNGYAGKIKFGSGTHTVGNIYVSGSGVNTYGYIDWGTATINITGYVNMTGVVNTTDGRARIIFTGSTATQNLTSAGFIFPLLYLNKSSGSVVMKDDLYCEDFTTISGTLNKSGYDLYRRFISYVIMKVAGRFFKFRVKDFLKD